jgi:ankyrin repeat protein
VKKKLPSRPNLEQLKKQAKNILKGHQAAQPEILKLIREHHPRFGKSADAAIAKTKLALSDAQVVLARQYGFDSWAKLKTHTESQATGPVNQADVLALRDAAGHGDLAEVNALLDAHPEIINERGGEGVRTALHSAVFGKQEAALKLLLERGADPNVRCEGDYAYPLHFACEKQLFPMIRLLVEHGADTVGEGDYHELGVLGWLTAWGSAQPNREIVDYLLAHGARHNIFSAVATGDVNAIRELVAKNPADLEKRMDASNHRRMPLHLAVMKKQVESLETLLELGANTESLAEAALTPLDQAALNGEKDLAQILIDNGATIRLPSAIALHRTRDVEKLMKQEPGALKPGNRWGTLIIRAAESSPGDVIIEELIRLGASVNVHDSTKTAVDNAGGYTALHAAAWNGNASAAAALIKHGANVAAREDKWHGTPGGWADYAGHKELGDFIRRGPVDIMEAVEAGLTERVEEILKEDPGALERRFSSFTIFPLYAEGWFTPLAFAVRLGKTEMVKFLLERGANPNVGSPEGKSLAEIAPNEETRKLLAG